MIRRWLRRWFRGAAPEPVTEAPDEASRQPQYLAEQLQSGGPHQEWALARLDMDNASTVLPHAVPYLVHSQPAQVELAFERIEPLVLPRLGRTWLHLLPTLASMGQRQPSERLTALVNSVERMLQVSWNAGMLAEGERSQDRLVRKHAWRLGLQREPLDLELAEAAYEEEVIVRAELLDIVQDDVDWLRRFLTDPAKRLRRQAFDQIVELRPRGWLDDLRRALLDGDRDLREAAAYYLRQEGQDPAASPDPSHLRLVESQLGSPDPSTSVDADGTIAALERTLRAPGGELKRKALELLGERAEQIGVPRLLELAGDVAADTRAGVRKIVVHLNPSTALALLLRSLTSAPEGERRELRALLEHHAQRAETLPRPLTTDETELVTAELEIASEYLPSDQIRRLESVLAP